MATRGGKLVILEYLINEMKIDPATKNGKGEDCLTIAISNKMREVATWLVMTDKFQLEQIEERRGFNYFAYALVKGQQVIANEIYQQLKMQGKDTE